jgi:thioesterase domain-containing protein
MAACYVEAMRKAQRHGPYRLAGYCVGGLVAFEMARQLRQAGEELELLAIIDSRADRARRADLEEVMIEGLAAYSFAAELNTRVSPELLERVGPERWMETIWEEFRRQSGEAAGRLGIETFRRLYRVFVANRRASWTYLPGTYDGKVLLFEPQSSSYQAEARDAALGWREVCTGGIERVVLPGGHVSLMRDPQVSALARHLRDFLAPPPQEVFPQPDRIDAGEGR